MVTKIKKNISLHKPKGFWCFPFRAATLPSLTGAGIPTVITLEHTIPTKGEMQLKIEIQVSKVNTD